MAHQASTESAPDLVRADDLPLGAQLAWRLRALIGSGQLGPGDRLPGVRELASGAGVNVNTARAVYRRLEEDGLIESRHGLGTFVAEDAPVSPDLEAPIEVPEVAIEPGAEADERLGRRELRRQIARLEAQLASYPADARKP